MTLQRFLVAIVLAPVELYRRFLSPLKRTPTCIYLPTCSQYAIDAVKSRGVVVGTALAVARILRCNPLFHGGYHPAPARCDHGSPSASARGAHGSPSASARCAVAHPAPEMH